jgi:hypothetical protein
MAMSLASLLTGGKQPDRHLFADASLGDQGIKEPAAITLITYGNALLL